MRRLLSLFIISLCVACAQAPAVDNDLARADNLRGALNHLDILRREGERISGAKFVSGNSVQLISDGPAAYPAMLNAIGQAHHRIDMESYEFDEGAGRLFAAALIKARARGVVVNLIYDAWGSADTSDELFDRLRDHGVNVVEYNPIDPASYLDFSVNERDHRKLLIIDGKTVFTGGINVSNVYKRKLKHILHPSAKEQDIEKLPWRDTQVKIEGPVVAEFERLFMQVWREQEGDPIPDPPPTPDTPQGYLMVQAIDGTPGQDRYAIYRSLLFAMAMATKSIHLTTAYFVPTPPMLNVLEMAAHRGVDVTLILPSQSDSDLALKAGHDSYDELMESGVKIYERLGAVLHAKTAVIDGIWSTVGSSNLDWRSVVYNNECNAVILGDDFGSQMEKMFRDDLSQSRRIDPAEWGERSFFEAIDEWKSRIIEEFL